MFEFTFCPVCGEDKSVEKIKATKSITIRNEKIVVEGETYHCKSCGEDFGPLEDTFDFIEKARQIYREKHKIPSPDQIKKFMEEYNFSLRDLEKISGIAFKTIDRYLKGAIPDPSNANLLKALMFYPQFLLDMLDQNVLRETKKVNQIRKKLLEKIDEAQRYKCTKCIFKGVSTEKEWKAEVYDEEFKDYTQISSWKTNFLKEKEKNWKKNITNSLAV